MSASHIDEILNLVGRLDDLPGEQTGREKFRRYLLENVTDPGQLKRYIDQCLARSEERYVRALQDLVNHMGRLLEFDVTFGPYEWLPGQIAFNGRWESTWGPNIIIEIRKREVYSPYRPTLSRVIEQLIDDGEIPSWNLAVGLYVIARPRVHFTHLEKAILEHVQAHQLRIASLDSLFTLADLKHRNKLSHQDVLTVLRSSSPTTNWLIELVKRLAERAPEPAPAASAAEPEPSPPPAAEPEAVESEPDTEDEIWPEEELRTEEPHEDAARETAPQLGPELEKLAVEIVRAIACFGDCLARTFDVLFTTARRNVDEL